MDDMPLLAEDYLNYMESIRGASDGTIKNYYFDLRLFLRFMMIRKRKVKRGTDLDDIDIFELDIDFFKNINIQDLHAFIAFADKDLQNGDAAKSRKVAVLKSFFEYLFDTVEVIDRNPATKLEFPKKKKRNPSYLTLEESKKLLEVVNENPNDEYRKRDFAIIFLFLNCGLRLSELSSINIDDINDKGFISIIGKGNKERNVYLNDSVKKSINEYILIRPNVDTKALFISKRKNRLSNRAIQHMVDKYLEQAGLDTKIYSTHSLRHTAATLMYKHGDVDIRAIQGVLGHESVSTTQIYTHLDDERLIDAVNKNPLSDL